MHIFNKYVFCNGSYSACCFFVWTLFSLLVSLIEVSAALNKPVGNTQQRTVSKRLCLSLVLTWASHPAGIQSPISSPDDTWVLKSDFTLFWRGNTYCIYSLVTTPTQIGPLGFFHCPTWGSSRSLRLEKPHLQPSMEAEWWTCVLPGASSVWKRIQISEGQRMSVPSPPPIPNQILWSCDYSLECLVLQRSQAQC